MTSQSFPHAVIFDWDNTLVDSWPVIQDALNTTFRAYGLAEWDLEETRAKVRHSIRDSFPNYFGDEWEQAAKIFYARYGEIHADAIRPAHGASELLSYLADTDTYLGIVSNKRGDYLRDEAVRLGWADHFGKIIGAFDAERDKPDPLPIQMALEPAKLTASPNVWFVGDADIDMTCAFNAGCKPILVRPEPPKDKEFQAHQPEMHFPDCDQLCKFLQTM